MSCDSKFSEEREPREEALWKSGDLENRIVSILMEGNASDYEDVHRSRARRILKLFEEAEPV